MVPSKAKKLRNPKLSHLLSQKRTSLLGNLVKLLMKQVVPHMSSVFWRTLIPKKRIHAEQKKKEAGDTVDKLSDIAVRVHDQCLTSEVVHEGAILLYMQQEGRGIGLANKIAAYSLQESGFDTVDANRVLGYEDDLRTYDSVKYILDHLAIKSIQLMTNNPRKIRLLEEAGIKISKVVPAKTRPNPHNLQYLRTKIKRMAHRWSESDLITRYLATGLLNENESPESQGAHEGLAVSPDTSAALVAAAEGSVVPFFSTSNSQTRDNSGPPSSSEQNFVDAERREAAALASFERSRHKTLRWHMGRKSVVDALTALSEGKIIIVSDEESRENEGDFIAAAEHSTPEMIAYMVRKSSGVLCAPMVGARLDELKLPPMKIDTEDPRSTAFSMSVDFNAHQTTGISARSRSDTFRTLACPNSLSTDFQRPGHVFPLRARTGGVLSRGGHTEAAVDMLNLAGVRPVGVIGEITSEWDPTDMA
eukprot:Selendium_serpulae@DN5993_c0_g1_i2.p1